MDNLSSKMRSMEIETKVKQYEAFANETLKKDLNILMQQRDKYYEETAQYLHLKSIIEKLMEKEEGELIKTKVDLGCNFFAEAVVPETKSIFVCIGFGFYVDFTYPEALSFIEKKVNRLGKTTEEVSEKITQVKANIRIVHEGLRELQGLK